MEWRDEGIVLGTRKHGESSAILEVMTRAHGRHLGLVRGGRSRKQQPMLQAGNLVEIIWRARLDEHLGIFQAEPLELNAARLFDSASAIYAIQTLAAHLRLLPERDPHAALYEALKVMIGHLDEPVAAAELVVRFELLILEELGFGLDLLTCAATGAREDLAYVSPKSGRAVSRSAGRPWQPDAAASGLSARGFGHARRPAGARGGFPDDRFLPRPQRLRTARHQPAGGARRLSRRARPAFLATECTRRKHRRMTPVELYPGRIAPMGVGTIPLGDLALYGGLELLQRLIDGRYPVPPMAATLGFTLTGASEGRVVFHGMPGANHLNPLGGVHGGWAATIMDSALGCAVHSTLDVGEAYTTAEFKVLTRPITRIPAKGLRGQGGIVRTLAVSEATSRTGRQTARLRHETCSIFPVGNLPTS